MAILTLAAGRSARRVSRTFLVTTSGDQPAETACFSISGNSPAQIAWISLTRSRSALTAATAASFAVAARSTSAFALTSSGCALRSSFSSSAFSAPVAFRFLFSSVMTSPLLLIRLNWAVTRIFVEASAPTATTETSLNTDF